jgi:hypothetical protein
VMNAPYYGMATDGQIQRGIGCSIRPAPYCGVIAPQTADGGGHSAWLALAAGAIVNGKSIG